MILLQVLADTTKLVQTQPQQYDKLNLFDLALKGGWLMIPIAALAVIAAYLFLERFIVIKKYANIDKNFMNKIRDLVKGGNIEGAKALCMASDTPISKMIEKGLSRIGNPLKDIAASIENQANLEISKLEKRLPALATIAGAEPMLGFLGTVTGMIKAFYAISKASSNVDPGVLAGGIYEAMVTTAAGLMVGIPALIAYNYLAALIKKVVFNMEATSVEFMDLLHEPV